MVGSHLAGVHIHNLAKE